MSWFPCDSDSAWQKRMRQFSSGFLAGALASFVTMPAEVIRANAQALRLNSLDASARHPTTTLSFLRRELVEHARAGRQVVAHRGLRGLWCGFQLKAMHLGGTGALVAMTMPFYRQLFGVTVETNYAEQGRYMREGIERYAMFNISSMFSTLPPIMMSSINTAIMMYPFDVLRALKMAAAGEGRGNASIYSLVVQFKNTHGYAGFVKQGSAPEMARSATMLTLKFFLFPIVHEAMTGRPPSEGTALTKALAGATCAIAEAVLITPLEVAKVGLQLDSKNRFNNSAGNVLKFIVSERGAVGAYTGYPGIQWRQSTWTGAYFGSLSFFHGLVKPATDSFFDDPTSTLAQRSTQFLSGFIAGAFASLFNTPADVVRTNVQKQRLSEPGAPQQLSLSYMRGEINAHLSMGYKIFMQRGIGGLYAGYSMKATHLGGSGALMAFMVPFYKSLFEGS